MKALHHSSNYKIITNKRKSLIQRTRHDTTRHRMPLECACRKIFSTICWFYLIASTDEEVKIPVLYIIYIIHYNKINNFYALVWLLNWTLNDEHLTSIFVVEGKSATQITDTFPFFIPCHHRFTIYAHSIESEEEKEINAFSGICRCRHHHRRRLSLISIISDFVSLKVELIGNERFLPFLRWQNFLFFLFIS